MPSLRRTTSSPNVRTSPYSSSARSSHPGRRASGGSDTARRRVLADMDWWAVLEGQSANRPVYTTTTTNDHNENHIFVPHTQQFNPETAPEPITRPTTPAGSSVNTFESRITLGSPIPEFAALSIAPRAVPLTVRRHTFPATLSSSSIFSDDSFSSAGSSPDLSPVPLTPPPAENKLFMLSFVDEYIPDFRGQNATPPRPSLRSPCRAASWAGYSTCDDEGLSAPLFGYGSSFDSFQSGEDYDVFH